MLSTFDKQTKCSCVKSNSQNLSDTSKWNVFKNILNHNNLLKSDWTYFTISEKLANYLISTD